MWHWHWTGDNWNVAVLVVCAGTSPSCHRSVEYRTTVTTSSTQFHSPIPTITIQHQSSCCCCVMRDMREAGDQTVQVLILNMYHRHRATALPLLWPHHLPRLIWTCASLKHYNNTCTALVHSSVSTLTQHTMHCHCTIRRDLNTVFVSSTFSTSQREIVSRPNSLLTLQEFLWNLTKLWDWLRCFKFLVDRVSVIGHRAGTRTWDVTMQPMLVSHKVS